MVQIDNNGENQANYSIGVVHSWQKRLYSQCHILALDSYLVFIKEHTTYYIKI